MKSYTDLEQSKKLAEILPIESADMFYDGVQDLYKEKVYNIPINGSSITVRTGHLITKKDIKANLLLPCWSLAALLSVIREAIGYTIYGVNNVYMSCDLGDKPWKLETEVYGNEVDACVEMILKLHELNLL